ncbi:MAG: Hsp20/alpha crystallin family protein [Deltaproteobacteria bacterium]|nr:Hsp20/alpha crystallin family protein [Deltaproteobacteria bacterium]
MAKISKKSPRGRPSIEIDNLNQFIIEGIEQADNFLKPEPITHIPNVDIFSTPADVIIEVELPGVRKEDIDVAIVKNTLTLRTLKLECLDDEKVNYVCMERAFGRVFRTIELPCPVDTARIKAVYKNGVLTISIPRVEDKRSCTRKVLIESK